MKRASVCVVSVFIAILCVLPLCLVEAFADTDTALLKQIDQDRKQKHEEIRDFRSRTLVDAAKWRIFADDADDDGMPDAWETDNGLNANDPDDAWLDPDTDHVVNLFEYQLGSNPNGQTTPPKVNVPGNYATLDDAIDEVSAGTCIRMAEGTYAVNYTTFSSRVIMIQGGWNPDFTTRDLKTYETVLDGSLQEEILYFSFSSGTPTVVLDGLTFIRGQGGFGAINLLAKGSASLKASFLDCTITKSNADYEDDAVLSMNNWDTSQSDRTLANTVIAGNEVTGIDCQVTESGVGHWRIINATISENHVQNSDEGGYGIEAFTLDEGVLSIHAYNSIIWGNDQDDLVFEWSNITVSADHSDIGRTNFDYGAVYEPGEGMMNADPLFVQPDSSDFHLQSGSPCIDKGTDSGIPLTDFEGDARTTGTAPDLGADEKAASGIVRGDVNRDGSVNVLDILTVANHLLSIVLLDAEQQTIADCTGDGPVNVLDMIAIANVIMSVYPVCPGGGERPVITNEALYLIQSLNIYLPPEAFSQLMAMVKSETTIPGDFTLSQNYPNPFNPTTAISYQLPATSLPGLTTLKVYNTQGQEVATLVDGLKEPGAYTVHWDASHMPSGVYFFRIESGGFVETRRMVLLK